MSGLGFQKSNALGWGGAVLAWFLAGTPAMAQDGDSLALSPFQVPIGEAQLSVGGTASGAVFDSNLKRQPAASGSA